MINPSPSININETMTRRIPRIISRCCAKIVQGNEKEKLIRIKKTFRSLPPFFKLIKNKNSQNKIYPLSSIQSKKSRLIVPLSQNKFFFSSPNSLSLSLSKKLIFKHDSKKRNTGFIARGPPRISNAKWKSGWNKGPVVDKSARQEAHNPIGNGRSIVAREVEVRPRRSYPEFAASQSRPGFDDLAWPSDSKSCGCGAARNTSPPRQRRLIRGRSIVQGRRLKQRATPPPSSQFSTSPPPCP